MSSMMKYEDKALKVVGTRPIRPDGVDKVTGRARFAADYNLPGQLVGKVLRSPHAHARLKSIDTSAAEALPGVKAVVTREDFADMPSEFAAAGEALHPLQSKFVEHAALQCGICTPGILIAARALLERNPNPTEAEVRFWLAGNLCRCTGYHKIVEAVLDAAREMREGQACRP